MPFVIIKMKVGTVTPMIKRNFLNDKPRSFVRLIVQDRVGQSKACLPHFSVNEAVMISTGKIQQMAMISLDLRREKMRSLLPG